ncbi:MAG: phage minor capsid protein [Bacillota bacterium]|jgi:hypothetical protein
MQIISGAFDYRTAVKGAIRDLTVKGLASITYPGGHTDYLDVAARRAIMTGVNQTAGDLQLARAKEMDTDLMELTAHHSARPSHAVWQGQLVSISGRDGYLSLDDIGYGDVTGFKGANCRHDWFPFVEGLDEKAYDADRLRDLNNREVTFNGEKMSLYDATQHQRYIERQIRRWKREGSAYDAAGLDNSFAKGKVREWQARQRDFISQTGLSRDYFRERAGVQNLELSAKSGIIALDKAGRDIFAKMEYQELAANNIKASNLAVRQWYDEHIKSIPSQVDTAQSLEKQARQAYSLRNQYKEEARNLMADMAERAKLDAKSPAPDFDYLLNDKIERKGLTREEALKDIIKTATKSNEKVNKEVGYK